MILSLYDGRYDVFLGGGGGKGAQPQQAPAMPQYVPQYVQPEQQTQTIIVPAAAAPAPRVVSSYTPPTVPAIPTYKAPDALPELTPYLALDPKADPVAQYQQKKYDEQLTKASQSSSEQIKQLKATTSDVPIYTDNELVGLQAALNAKKKKNTT